MPEFRIYATVIHTFTSTDEVAFKVIADDEESAREKAHQVASDHSDPDSWNAEHDGTEIESLDIACDESGAAIVLRCPRTPDMLVGVGC